MYFMSVRVNKIDDFNFQKKQLAVWHLSFIYGCYGSAWLVCLTCLYVFCRYKTTEMFWQVYL